MITGGSSDDALLYGAYQQGIPGNGVEIGQGLGFYPGVMFDQHHLARGRLGRLIVATYAAGFEKGYGMDENSALAIDNDTGWADILGEMGIFVVDVRSVVENPDNTRSGIILHYLDTGDRIHMETGEVETGEHKTILTDPQNPPGEITSSNVWNDYEAWRLVTELAETSNTYLARGRDPNFDVLFQQSSRTRAWRGGAHTYGNTRTAYTLLFISMANVLHGEPFPYTMGKSGAYVY
jgi:hypothetical protein